MPADATGKGNDLVFSPGALEEVSVERRL